MTLSRSAISLLLASLLSSCSVFNITPKSPPPPTHHAQEITRAQTVELEKIATISAVAYGSSMDVEAEIQRKANVIGARYYMIITNSESVIPGRWYSQAILYR